MAGKRGRPRKNSLPEEIQLLVDDVLEKAQELQQQQKEELPTHKEGDWDVKINDHIEFFDKRLSYELTGYRPITETEGLDFNPKWFTEARDTKIATGHYTSYYFGSKAYRDFWNEEYKRCREGMTVNGYTVPGTYYYFLNYYLLPQTEVKKLGTSRLDIFPEFYSAQYEFFHYFELCKVLKKDCGLFKARGVGFSEINAAICNLIYNCFPNSVCMLTANALNYIDKSLDKIWGGMTFANDNTDGGFFKLRQVLDKQMAKKASYYKMVNGQKVEDGWGSLIEAIVADNDRKIRGDRVDLLLYEEAGSNPVLRQSYIKGNALVEIGGNKFGIRMVGGKLPEHLIDKYYKLSNFKILKITGMTREEKLQIINSAVEYYKNSTNPNDSIKKVSKQFGIRQETLSKYLKERGINIRPQVYNSSKSNKLETISDELKSQQGNMSKSQFKQYLIDLAVEEYINTSIYERSIPKLSNKYGLNRKTITKYLKERNIEITNTHGKIPFNEEFFDNINTEEKAYWLGFLYADGYISSKDFRIGLSISIKDIEHLEKYGKSLNYSKGMNIVTSHQFGSKDIHNKNGETIQMCRTVITNKHMWKALNSKGCMPNKSLILKFPEESIFSSKDLIKHFIRGYVDGDGTLGVYPHSKTNPNLEASLLIVGTKLFLEGVQKYLGIEGFLMQKSNCNELTYRLGYSTLKAEKVADILYKDATIYLNRKYNIYTTKFAALKSGKNGES